MPENVHSPLAPRRVTRAAPLRIFGVTRRVTHATVSEIPLIWDQATREMVLPMNGVETYGACFDFEGDSFTYMAGLVDDGRIDTEHFDHLVLPAGDYAVFDHEGHISSINETWAALFEGWFPGADVTPTAEPEFEVYAADFDAGKAGGVSIWIPVKPKEG